MPNHFGTLRRSSEPASGGVPVEPSAAGQASSGIERRGRILPDELRLLVRTGDTRKLIELRRVALVGLDTGLVAESSFSLLLGPSLVDQLSEVVPKRAHDARTAELDAMRRRT
ncbi:MAG TPA: hypothetical protein VE528_04650 [Thermoleophilaceae bacterium]|nr:hypothetical protein [Thermoleophilaceae bacterium]